MNPEYSLTVTYDFGDYLPEIETETPHLLEECPPELLVVDEADYGDE